MYKDWKMLKTDYSADTAKEYETVANWCNESGEYHIEDDGEYYKVAENPKPTQEEKEASARATRDAYLAAYVDPLVTNPLRWNDLSEAEQNNIKAYRQYLLDVPQTEGFPGNEILTYDEWKK